MLAIDDCLARAQAFLDRQFAEPDFYEDPDTGEIRPHDPCPVEVMDHRITPRHVLVAYHARPDPLTGERPALCGAYPLNHPTAKAGGF